MMMQATFVPPAMLRNGSRRARLSGLGEYGDGLGDWSSIATGITNFADSAGKIAGAVGNAYAAVKAIGAKPATSTTALARQGQPVQTLQPAMYNPYPATQPAAGNNNTMLMVGGAALLGLLLLTRK
jgi:hypothetical protein